MFRLAVVVFVSTVLFCASADSDTCTGSDCQEDEVSMLLTKAKVRSHNAISVGLKWCLLGYKCAPMDFSSCPGNFKGIPVPCLPCFYDFGNQCSTNETSEQVQAEAEAAPRPSFGNVVQDQVSTLSTKAEVRSHNATSVGLEWCLLGYKCAPMDLSSCPGNFKGIPVPCLPCFYDFGNQCSTDETPEQVQAEAEAAPPPSVGNVVQDQASMLSTKAKVRSHNATSVGLEWCLLGYKCAPMDFSSCPGNFKGIPVPCLPCFYDFGNQCSTDEAPEQVQAEADLAPRPSFGNVVQEEPAEAVATLATDAEVSAAAVGAGSSSSKGLCNLASNNCCILGYKCAPATDCPARLQSSLGAVYVPCLPCFYSFGNC